MDKQKLSLALKEKMRAVIAEKTVDDGDCLIWTGRTNGRAGHPKYGRYAMRRVAWELVRGVVPDGMLVSTTCRHSGCLSHLCLKTRTQVSEEGSQSIRTLMLKRAKSSKWARANIAKINLDIARQIRESDEFCYVLADRYGIHKSMVSRIKRGLDWSEYVSGLTPFTGLAANDSGRKRA